MKRTGKYAFWIGLLIIFIGFNYDMIYAGIPPQDAPTALQIKYDHHANIAGWIYTIGQCIAAAGALIWLVGVVRQIVVNVANKRSKNTPSHLR
jgi:hypothetical protein